MSARFASFPFSLITFVSIGASQKYAAELVDGAGYPLEIVQYSTPVALTVAIETARDMRGHRSIAARVTDERGAIVWSMPR